jgi:hypothetical protein
VRVILDTNILLSALIRGDSVPSRISKPGSRIVCTDTSTAARWLRASPEGNRSAFDPLSEADCQNQIRAR